MWTNKRFAEVSGASLIAALLLGLAVVSVRAGDPPDDPPPPPDRGGNPPPRRDRGDAQQPRRDRGDKGRRDESQRYSIEQAISDQAQLHTIAFSGLAFLTGDFGADTFIPPGKVCDFFGFQYMRDIDATQKGHNPMFLDRVAGNVLKTLTDAQRKTFETLARKEAEQLNLLAQRRWPLIKAFCRQLGGEIPSGSPGLNQAAVVQYVGDLFAFDAELSLARAEAYGAVAAAMTPEQKAYLGRMKFGDFTTWPEVDMDAYKLPRGTEKLVNVAYMTYASEFFSWTAGSVEADTYFCPERHGTYFGGFYMKDMPAMGKRDFDISTSLTGDSGKTFLEILDDGQRKAITAIPDLQRKALKESVDVRRAVSMELRKPLKDAQPDKAKVLALCRRYGELDGEMSFYCATAFAKVNRSLTPAQRASLVKLRNLDGYTSAPAYIYSSPVKDEPKLPDTDSFFFPPRKGGGEGR
jgi:Spy/CpxP family protein refolding chaperone